jgi:hypothetical protein
MDHLLTRSAQGGERTGDRVGQDGRRSTTAEREMLSYMADESRQRALLALRLVTDPSLTDDDLAAHFGSHQAVAEATAYLAGFILQALALHRGEDVKETAAFLRHWLNE